MQAARSNRVKLGENLNPSEDATGVDAVDFSADLDNLISKLDKPADLYDSGKVDADLLRYIPGMSKRMYQEQIDWTKTRRSYAASTYTDSQMLEFNIELTANHYINFLNMILCLPISFLYAFLKASKSNAIDGDMIL